jgi:hypothetical protein
MITKSQEKWVLAVFLILILDAAISIYGVTVYNASFYEVNPLLALAGNVDAFVSLVVATKVIAMTSVVIIVSYMNENLNEKWGNAGCYLAAGICAGSMLILTLINLIVNFG